MNEVEIAVLHLQQRPRMKQTKTQADFDAREQWLRDLLLLGLDGDARAYHAFLRELSADLRTYFRKRLSGLPDEIEDLVQETLLAVHNQRQTYLPSQPLSGWTYAIAKYKLVDLLRRRSRRDVLNDPLEEETALAAPDESNAVAARRDLAVLLDRLPERQRLPIVHTKLEGLTVAEAAQRTGMSESAIKVGVHRGLRTLANLMRGEK